jgi:hypothetical protein
MFELRRQALAIETLVRDRCEELGLKPVELVRRCGYQNVAKGLRRLEQLRAGDFARTSGLLRTLLAALQVPLRQCQMGCRSLARSDGPWLASRS